MKTIKHKVKRYEQVGPNCGPNALAQLMSFYGKEVDPLELVKQTRMMGDFGTWDADIGKTATLYGFKPRIITLNINTFTPQWYSLGKQALIKKLQQRAKKVKGKLQKQNAQSFVDYLRAGGKLAFKPISREFLIDRLKKRPIIVGLSSTYLYKLPPKKQQKIDADFENGHFVVLDGYDPKTDKFSVVDPWYKIPFSKSGRYKLKSDELIAAIYLGEATYDCTVLELD